MRSSARSTRGPAVAALLVVSLSAGAVAEDDFPVRARGNAAREGRRARVAEAPPEEPVGPFVLVLANGDRLTGTVVGLEAGRLRFRPDATGDVDLAVPVAKIEAFERSRPEDRVEPRGDRVYPVAGGVIHGVLTDIDARRIAIDAHLVGPLELDLENVAAFVRHDAEQPERTAADAAHEVHGSAGSRLVGQVAFGPTGVKVSSPGLTAEIALREVTAILFPVVETAVATAAERPATCTVELVNGGEIVGTAPRLEEERIVVDVGGTRTAAVPLDHVARAGFGAAAAGGGSRRVLLWTRCADPDEEAAHMAEALEAGLPAGWKVVVDADTGDADQLAAALKPAGVLVVAEMESFDADELPEPGELGRVLRAFLARGGTVVLAGVNESDYWSEAGVVAVSSAIRVDDEEEFTIARGHPLGRGVGVSFAAENGTYEYETDDEALRPVATRDGGGAAVLVKKAGRGTIVLLGMDYYERSEAIDRLLVNAVTQGRGLR